jgi:putative endonuclease
MTPTVYILYSPTLQKFYVGFTASNIAQRLRKHLARHSGFTAKAKDWALCISKPLQIKNCHEKGKAG